MYKNNNKNNNFKYRIPENRIEKPKNKDRYNKRASKKTHEDKDRNDYWIEEEE
jgi:hypothetical protein